MEIILLEVYDTIKGSKRILYQKSETLSDRMHDFPDAGT